MERDDDRRPTTSDPRMAARLPARRCAACDYVYPPGRMPPGVCPGCGAVGKSVRVWPGKVPVPLT